MSLSDELASNNFIFLFIWIRVLNCENTLLRWTCIRMFYEVLDLNVHAWSKFIIIYSYFENIRIIPNAHMPIIMLAASLCVRYSYR